MQEGNREDRVDYGVEDADRDEHGNVIVDDQEVEGGDHRFVDVPVDKRPSRDLPALIYEPEERPSTKPRPANAVTPSEEADFLRYLAQTGRWNQAAYRIGRTPVTFRLLAKDDPGFCVRVQDALQDYYESLQAELLRRAVVGVVKPVFGKISREEDGVVGYERVYSDRLLELEIKASNRAKYRPELLQTPGAPDMPGAKTGVVEIPERARTHEEWEAKHGPDAKKPQREKVTVPVGASRRIARRSGPKDA